MFLTFAKIGSFTIGGGYAMIQMMEREVVEKKRWLDHEEFMNTLVVAQSTPGLFAIDMASHIGLKLKGIKGGIVAALAVVQLMILNNRVDSLSVFYTIENGMVLVMTVIFSAILFKEKINRNVVIGIVMSVISLALLSL